MDVPTWSFAPEEQRAIRGRSGLGKTTLLHLIAGVLAPDAGSIRVAETELVRLGEGARDRWRARTLGYVHQNINLLQSLTALENVRMAMSLAGKDDPAAAKRLLERVGLGDRLGYRPSMLSAGQQQRVAVARALANRPRLVLADEPTAALDPENRDEILALLKETCAEYGSALLLVSHDETVLGTFAEVTNFSAINRASGVVPL